MNEKSTYILVNLFLILNIKYLTVNGDDELLQNNTNEAKELFTRDFASSTYLLFDIFKFLPMINVSAKCFDDVKQVERAIETREIWGIKALEASAMIHSNFIYGNHYWLGSKDECSLINNPKTVTFTQPHYKMTNEHLLWKPDGLEMSFKITRANITQSPLEADNRYFRNKEILHIGLCLPKSCDMDDVRLISKEYLHNNQSLTKRVYDITVNNIEVSDLGLNFNFYYKKTLIMIGTIILLTLIIVGASLTPLNGKSEKLSNILNVFHPKRNLDTIYIVTPTEFPEMNGLKFIGAFIICLFHVLYFSSYKLTSRFLGFQYAETIQMQIISNGALFVDMFLVMSGFLTAHNYLKNKEKTESLADESTLGLIKFFTSNLYKRLVRIVPLYVVIILVTEVVSTYFRDTSVIMLWDTDDTNCRNYWWRNLLFIQNFYTLDDLCMNWSWSVACEMQYFITLTILYIIYSKNKRIGKMSFWFLVCFTTIISTYFLIKNNFSFSFDKLFNTQTFDDNYINPLSRASPYMMGIGMAYFIVCRDVKISKYSANTIWVVILTLLPITLGCTVNRSIASWLAIAIVVPMKWIMPFCYGWFFLSPRLGHTNPITKGLAHDTFYHFGKIAYAFYLVNPVVLIVMNGSSDSLLPVDAVAILVHSAGICIIAYQFAVICTLLFEMPYIKLYRLCVKKKTNKQVTAQKKFQKSII